MPSFNRIYGTDASEEINWAYGTTHDNDIIYAGGGHDKIWGFGGNDVIYAGDGDDIVYGGYGDDQIDGGRGADQINGEQGNDTASYLSSSAGVTVSLSTGKGNFGDAEGDTYTSIENVTGSQHRDFIFGDEQSNWLFGMAGNDVLYGYGGFDNLQGGSGNDTLNGGAGGDWLNGGAGSDAASYTGSSVGVEISLLHNGASGGDAEGDTLISIENLTGSSHDDQLWGDNYENVIDGGNGNDSVKGFGGDDALKGGFGDDVLHGGSGADTLIGGSGNDTLYGGEGYHDQLEGGFGADTFRWNSANETGWSAYVADVVVDFNHAQGDVLDISNIDADVTTAGNQSFTFIGNAAFSGAAGEVRYFYADGNTYIEMQIDAGTSADAVICLEGIQFPTEGWFVL